MVKFGSARIDENGRARGGKRGDQTGCECMIQQAYWHKNGWRGIKEGDNAFEDSFNASMVWGPLMGRKIYGGLRFTLWKK